MTISLVHTTLDSPFGQLRLVAGDGALVGVQFPIDRHPIDWDSAPRRDPVLAEASRQLAAYFAGGRTAFDLPLAPSGTEFQQTVWRVLRDIPFGVTWSYGALARAIGQPSASRAVGAANGRNPIPIIIPCHRVIGSDGSLTGYGGGELAKRWLLDHEAGVAGAGRGQLDLFGPLGQPR